MNGEPALAGQRRGCSNIANCFKTPDIPIAGKEPIGFVARLNPKDIVGNSLLLPGDRVLIRRLKNLLHCQGLLPVWIKKP